MLGVHELPKGGTKAGSHGKLEESRNSRELLFVTILVSLMTRGRECRFYLCPTPTYVGRAQRRSS